MEGLFLTDTYALYRKQRDEELDQCYVSTTEQGCRTWATHIGGNSEKLASTGVFGRNLKTI
jgi:hypothetical protein